MTFRLWPHRLHHSPHFIEQCIKTNENTSKNKYYTNSRVITHTKFLLFFPMGNIHMFKCEAFSRYTFVCLYYKQTPNRLELTMRVIGKLHIKFGFHSVQNYEFCLFFVYYFFLVEKCFMKTIFQDRIICVVRVFFSAMETIIPISYTTAAYITRQLIS